MNLVIGKAVELRDVKSKENPKEVAERAEEGGGESSSVLFFLFFFLSFRLQVVRECRQLGLIVLRGEFVISISVIGQGTAKHSPEEAAAGKERRRRQQDPNSITFPLSSSVPRPRRRMSVDEASAADGRRVDKEDDSCNTQ